ncbi:MAG: hypothetical protein A2Y91_04955 [Chloroflexi bacterium RBG_13_54_8]|nr:MAG: hypothetical protein A2Y91_04955 [Chloroflexi bacterium RBG_13_54_8]
MVDPKNTEQEVCVLGIWHLGAIYSSCLANLGCNVVGVDPDHNKVEALNKGIPPLYEPGLDELMAKNIREKRLRYTTDLKGALSKARYAVVTYDTPVNDQDEVDLSEIYRLGYEFATCLCQDTTVIFSSQVPVGTCEKIASTIKERNPSLRFGMAYIPENLRLGQAIECFLHPDMLVIGADSAATMESVERLFQPIKAPRVKVNLRTAEMTKHAINTYLATCISYINEIANVCDEVSADAMKVAEALRLDSRVSPKAPLFPGLGFAGGTLARDLKVLLHLGEVHDCSTPLVRAVLNVNEQQKGIVIRKLRKIYGSLKGLEVGVLGLTYKPGTSTLRRSASVEIIRALEVEEAKVKVYDPKADAEDLKHYGIFDRCPTPYAAAEGSQALVLITPWPDFKELDFPRLRSLMQKPLLLDVQNMLDADKMEETGFLYIGIGRGMQLSPFDVAK